MSAPEGHNSQESMLQGGEGASIVPSQAGGGHSQESMLQGGEEVPIVPSQAGGGLNDELRKKWPDLPEDVKNKITTLKLDNIDELTAVIVLVDESPNIKDEEKANLLYKTLDNLARSDDIDKELNTATDEEKTLLDDPKFKDLDNNKKFLALSYYRESKTLKTISIDPGSSTEPIPVIKSNTTIEMYDIYIDNDLKKVNNDLKKFNFYIDKINFDASVDSTKLFKYIEHRNNEWNYLNHNQNSSIIKPQITTNPRKMDENTEFDQYGFCLPMVNGNFESHIIMIPPINGNILMFLRVLRRLENISAITYNKDTYEFKIKKNITMIFMPPFYNFDSVIGEYTNNIKLFNVFVDIWNSNINKIFVLSASISNNYVLGTWLFNKLVNKDTENNWPLTMIEPSYIIYPYTHSNSRPFIVSEFNIDKVDFASIVSTCLNIKNNKDFGIVVKKTTSDQSSNNIIKITSLNPKKQEATPGVLGNLSYSSQRCNGLIETKKNLADISNTFYIQKQDVDDKIAIDLIFIINLNNNIEKYKPLCLSSSEFNVDDGNLHIPNSDSKNSDNKEQIIIEDNIYSIRIPDDNKNVENDWENKIFTKDEADFLNVTFLRPKILEKVFGLQWNKYLKDFLYTLTTSKCMKDTSLLTNNECYNCRKFINKVEIYLIESNIKNDNIHHDRGFKKEDEEIENIQETDVDEAENDELKMKKLSFNSISSYDRTDNGKKMRAAFITAVNNKNKNYKFYIITVPRGNDRNDDDKKLMNKLDELKNKYKNFTFVY